MTLVVRDFDPDLLARQENRLRALADDVLRAFVAQALTQNIRTLVAGTAYAAL